MSDKKQIRQKVMQGNGSVWYLGMFGVYGEKAC